MSERNAAAGLALRERRKGLLAFHRLNVPATLNVTFLSTNLIENVLRNCLSPRLTGASPLRGSLRLASSLRFSERPH